MTVPAHVLAAVRSIPHPAIPRPRQEPDMNAPHPSPAEQAVIDRFGIFEPEERGLTALLGDLERAQAAATPGPWAQHPSDDEYVIGDVSDDGMSYADVGDTYAFRKREGSADAALIVAAVNAVPTLIAELRKRDAALRAVEALADELVDSSPLGLSALAGAGRAIRSALTAALSPESVTS